MTLDFSTLLPYTGEILEGLVTTVWLTAVTTVAGIALAVVVAYARDGSREGASGIVSRLLGAYVEVIRNTPFIVQLFFLFFGLPALGVSISATVAALLAMILNLGAYTAEILRAGIDSTARGQHEAARALGLSRLQSFRHVVLVPAFSRVYPSLISQCIIVMLGSAVVSQISVFDLTYAANFIQSRNFRGFEVYLVVTLIYLLLAVGLRLAFEFVGRRLFAFRQGGSS
ncbi:MULTISPECIES: amino acid ABC transporter permease [Salinicola]|jgi:polar amino acid transport system permease protein|uniref:amino acid ABC transporter permease n=1 Tax=Salinicola TaxID=404432 RepID=UPI0008DD8493|nr:MULTISPECIES: amino acid ABC transporter permease [Salinicola]MDF3918063.1 amino acid ABC transporter permease [Salinicola salarius]MEC8916439.1 amino acid ABC transporter permease [Pseudomonadota bacterium]MED5501361.1 amino acid ABC transporter permease [Pseudomonadota bacterium]OHZ03023.1 polar amino acid ABC transporter permease [Salinicola sp. MIT1003]